MGPKLGDRTPKDGGDGPNVGTGDQAADSQCGSEQGIGRIERGRWGRSEWLHCPGHPRKAPSLRKELT